MTIYTKAFQKQNTYFPKYQSDNSDMLIWNSKIIIQNEML